MSSLPAFSETLKKELFAIKSLLIIFLTSFLYYSFSVLIINYRLVAEVLFGNSSIFYKISLLSILVQGSYSALGPLDFLLLVLTSLLVGANLLVLFKVLNNLKKSSGKLTLTVGGTTALGVLVAGSCSCGFSFISILGLTGAVAFIPFGSLGLHIITIALLIISFFYSMRTYHEKIVCKIR